MRRHQLLGQLRDRVPILLPLLSIVVGELLVFLYGPFGMSKERSAADWIFLSIILIHLLLLYVYTARRGDEFLTDLFRIPELLFAITLLFFLFSYIYASNANMSYAQWFAETSGNIRLGPDSKIQRLNSMLRYLPFILFDGLIILRFRLARGAKGKLFERHLEIDEAPVLQLIAARWGLPLTLLSAILYTLALPFFTSIRGMPPLAFIALVPLYAVLRSSPYRWGLFYGVLFGSLQTMLSNYWLGTYSLISLQFAVVVLLIEYSLFFIPTLYLLRKFPRSMVWLLPLLWTGFDFLRSTGFLGYPWGILGTSQYRFSLFIQIAALGGIWAVNLAVHLTNSLLFDTLEKSWGKPAGGNGRTGGGKPLLRGRLLPFPVRMRPLALLAAMWIFILLYGGGSLIYWQQRSPEREIRVALIQQNTDPRKHDYRHTFETLTELTRKTLPEDPDLVAWSETAFVPNIRKWGSMEPDEHPLADLVHDFRAFQEDIDSWLVTGNDDYEEVELADGSLQRNHYNATVLFSDEGERVETYRKIRLVPFTEYFPYKEQLPWLHGLLKDFDATLWEKGEKPVILSHPKAEFCTPICFEDSFPGEIRLFVNEGAEMILNLSNDFWSRTRVEGEQHFANSLFRAVEHRRPLLRSTSSGKTAYISPSGVIQAELPYYSEATLTVDAALYGEPKTLYGLFGDWLPLAAVATAVVLLLLPGGRREEK